MRKQLIQPQWHYGWRPRLALFFVIFFVVAALVAMLPQASQAALGDAVDHAIHNGSFEEGFTVRPGCATGNQDFESSVGTRWSCFTNQGAANYGFYADAWTPVVADGKYSQLIEINTWGVENGDNNRYAGIYQTVPTFPGAEYQLSLRGMVRTTNMEGDLWRYRVQIGYIDGENPDWRDVKNWTDVGWDTYYPRTEPGAFSDYQTTIETPSDRLTLFIRVWKKWGLSDEELDVNLDTIRLVNLGIPEPKKPEPKK
jgi:hypothetical protein